MYETEANDRRESEGQIPPATVARLGEARHTILDRTVLPWSEHCTECVWPTCYSSCDLYSPREDGKCRRFVQGMVRVDCPEALNGYLLKITFKRWAKLWAPGNVRLHSTRRSLRIEHQDYRIGRALSQLPVPSSIKYAISGKRYGIKKRLAYRSKPVEIRPTSFLVECYNPATETARLSLSIRSLDERAVVPFQELFEIEPGFQRVRVSYERIAATVNLAKPFNVELIPNGDTRDVTLFFGLMDFVREVQVSATTSEPRSQEALRRVKCVVWDLDNTLWDGVLVEDGPEGLTLKPGIRQIMEQLDQRGILQSIASKNNSDEAVAALKEMGLEEFFLCPQISWLPKSGAINEIARHLNIGLDSVLFVDDSEFERQQVSAALPGVRTMDACRYKEILDLDECKAVVTAESRERREMYRVETQRQRVAAGFADDYMAFLRHCSIRLNIRSMIQENLERVHELTQRTNQMNFSGNRYDRQVLQQILAASHLDTYVLEVEDRFGAYGVVGFCVVDRHIPLMTDLMFSCRIQSKRVEHAFMAYLIRRYTDLTNAPFQADYRRTARNAPSGKVFADIGMSEVGNKDGVVRLILPKGQVVTDDGVVSITTCEPTYAA